MSTDYNDNVPEGEISLAMEQYCTLRASGRTKTEACKAAYPASTYPGKMGHDLEKDPRIINRIKELKEERAETYGLDVHEQIRKYHELYNMAVKNNQVATATKILQCIDDIGGFVVKKSETIKTSKEGLAAKDGDLIKNMQRFADVLGKSQSLAAEVPEDDDSIN